MAGEERAQASYTRIQPVVAGGWSARDPTADAEDRKRLREAWAAWDTACTQVPTCRAILEQVDRVLPEVEANLSAADRQLEAARAAYVLREVIGPGGGLLTNPEGQGMYTTHEDEEDRDPGILMAKTERTKWIRARGQLWRRADEARAVLAHAEGQRPPGERPRD